MSDQIKPIAFITNDIPYKDADYILEQINNYDPLRYLIVFEHPLGPKGYPHYHYLVWWTDKNYNAFIKKVREKYNLRGKAQKNLRKQYGRLKNIEDLEKLQTYMMKDQMTDLNDEKYAKYWRYNITDEDIEKFKKASFKKDNQTETCYKCIEYVKKNLNMIDEYQSVKIVKHLGDGMITYEDSIDYEQQVKLLMIQFHVEKDLRINKTTINNYYIEYIRSEFHKEGSTQTLTATTLKIYDKLFN